VDRRKLNPGNPKKAEKGPCAKGSGYEVGMHYTVKNRDNGEVVGSIGMCPCSPPLGGTANRYAILNHIESQSDPVPPTPVPTAGGPAFRYGGRTARNLVPRPVDGSGLSLTETPGKGWIFQQGKSAISGEGFEHEDDPTDRDQLHFLVRPGPGHISNGWTMPSWQATRDSTTEDPSTWHELTRRLRRIAS
jgi:hypothetical protein